MNIKVIFCLPTPDFQKSVRQELTVKMSLEPGQGDVELDPEYSVVIPDFMFTELANSEPQFKTEYDVNSRSISGCFSERATTRKFKKTQTAILLSQLKDYIYGLTQLLLDRHSPEKATMKKKIFISFTHQAGHTMNSLNGAYRGLAIQQRFNFFVGYEVVTEKFASLARELKGLPRAQKRYITKIKYANPSASNHHEDTAFQEVEALFLPLEGNGESTEQFAQKYVIIDYTREREGFCQQINETFQDVNKKLSDFLLALDGLQMDRLIEEGGFKLLN